MRYITLISSKTYQRPFVGRVPCASAIFHPPFMLFVPASFGKVPVWRRGGKRAGCRGVMVHPAQHRGSPMIKRYSDHAANERTFLAWVRTAIAVMAFGFVIERFDLFLKYIAPQAAQGMIAPHGGAFANAAGLAFIVLGVAIIVIADWRFVQTARDIDSEVEMASPGERFDLALAGMIGLLGAALFLYLSYAVFPAL